MSDEQSDGPGASGDESGHGDRSEGRRPAAWIPPTGGASPDTDGVRGPAMKGPTDNFGGAAINLPWPVGLLILSFLLVHVAIHDFLSPIQARYVTLALAFMPMRYALPAGVSPADLPGGWAAWLLSPVTHMFLHSGWGHLIINSVWLAAFGTPVARRLGLWRFLLLCALTAAAGALFYLVLHWGEGAVLVGASGAISGLMGAAVRLLYAGGDTLIEGLRRDLSRVRPLPLADIVRRSGPRTFVTIWLGLNLVFGIWGLGLPKSAGAIAWEAHVGGFLTGIVLLGLVDVRPDRREAPGGRTGK